MGLAVSGLLQEGALYVREAFVVLALGPWLHRLGQFRSLGVALPTWSTWRSMLRRASLPWADGVAESLFDRLLVLAAAAAGGERGAGMFFQAYRLAGVPHQLLHPLLGRMALNWFSREEDARARMRRRRQLVLLGAVPLGLAAAAAIVFADPVVPVVFGERWRPVVPILGALSGFILFNTLFATHKNYGFATNGIKVLLAARVLQYAGLGVALLPLLLGHEVDVALVGVGVSFAFGLALLTTAIGFGLTDRRERSASESSNLGEAPGNEI
ncbi:MAG: oligosaccharide flippase family protein [Deltaproteobacteria bacterium]|nr:oligosaccharide flippase family protein [Deltaproteobacteria bacterium]